jgi:hypothetical protein
MVGRSPRLPQSVEPKTELALFHVDDAHVVITRFAMNRSCKIYPDISRACLHVAGFVHACAD